MKRNLLNDIFPKNELEKEELEEFESLQRELKELEKGNGDALIEEDLEEIEEPREEDDAANIVVDTLIKNGTEKEIKIMSNMEIQELKDRFGGMKPVEKEIFLHGLSTRELYAELGRRLVKADKFTDELEAIIADYKKED